MTSVAIVVPTIRENCIREFLVSWANEFETSTVIVVEDNPQRTFSLENDKIIHFAWEDIDNDLGQHAWIIPRRTDCIRSYGFLKAWEFGADIVISLDDDCFPHTPQFVQHHVEKLSTTAQIDTWCSTIAGITPRGVPYRNRHHRRPIKLNHGLWVGVPDFDAITQLSVNRLQVTWSWEEKIIPPGVFFPMCGMNVAFRRELLPALYFLLMGKDWPYDRFGDIWAGIFVKKICDHLGFAVSSGKPLIEHRRASDVWANLRKEMPGYEINETLWEIVYSLRLRGDCVMDCYSEIASALRMQGGYWSTLASAMEQWLSILHDRAPLSF